MRYFAACVLIGMLGLVCGCGVSNNKCLLSQTLTIGSSSATNTANHASAPPANQVKFNANIEPSIVSGTGCAVPQFVAVVDATWTSSDTKDVTISSAPDSTNGTATCLNATDGSVTITATAPIGATVTTSNTATTTLTCK